MGYEQYFSNKDVLERTRNQFSDPRIEERVQAVRELVGDVHLHQMLGYDNAVELFEMEDDTFSEYMHTLETVMQAIDRTQSIYLSWDRPQNFLPLGMNQLERIAQSVLQDST